jgi:hypothetical protein
MYQYNTLSEAVSDLRARGYTLDFNIIFDKIHCIENGLCLNPAEFEITEFHRFEGNTDPSDEEVIYAVESKDGKIKGMITAAYGTYSEGISDEMIQKLRINTERKK